MNQMLRNHPDTAHAVSRLLEGFRSFPEILNCDDFPPDDTGTEETVRLCKHEFLSLIHLISSEKKHLIVENK